MVESDNQRNSTTKRLVIDDSNCFDARLSTGEQIEVKKTSILPLVDCHMHIQSLHATPIPIQWGAGFFNSGKLAREHGNDRKTMTETTAARNITGNIASMIKTKDFGKIGQLSTDLIAKFYMNDLKKGDIKQELFWMLWTDEQLSQYEKTKEELKEEAAEWFGGWEYWKSSESLVIEREKMMEDFYKSTAYYYCKSRVFYLSFAMPMDLSFAHFWGAHGLPVNLPVPGKKSFYYIDDLYHLRELPEVPILDVERRYEPYNFPDSNLHHLSYCFDFERELNNYLDYMGYKNNLPGYNRTPEETPFLITFEHNRLEEVIGKKMSEITPLRYELLKKGIDRERRPNEEELKLLQAEYNRKTEEIVARYNKILSDSIDSIREKYKQELTSKSYRHFIAEIPGDDSEIFEDYYLQLAYTEVSAFRYPLQLIPFYHYDPRRYYSDSSQLDSMAKRLKERHAFYRCTSEGIHLKNARPTLASRPSLSLFELEGVKKDYYLEMFEDRYTDRQSQLDGIPKKIGNGTMKENSYALDKIYPNGSFMGVKLYPALGYPPDLYDRNKHCHEGGDYCDNQFSGLEELYNHCEKNQVPVLAHCCPKGMSIADGFNYEIRDERKRQNDQWRPRDYYDVNQSVYHMDDIGGHPRNWEPVLEKFPKLKLCLAHFAGQDVWADAEKAKREKGIDDWRTDLIYLIDKYDNVYTDLAYFSLDITAIPSVIDKDTWRIKIENSRLDEKYKEHIRRLYKRNSNSRSSYYNDYMRNASTERDKFLARAILRKAGVINDDLKKIATNLARAIDIATDLKERIMVGTDWYMVEVEQKGTGPYYARLFELSKLITIELGERYDVWHQFSVVNPLNFIGFLKSNSGVLETEKVNGREAYIFDPVRIKDYIKNLENIPHSRLKYYDVKQHEIDNFKRNASAKVEKLLNSTIYTAEEMRNRNDGLLIIEGKGTISKNRK